MSTRPTPPVRPPRSTGAPARVRPPAAPSGIPAPLAALAGVVAIGAALAIGELAAGFAGGPSPLVAVGQVVVDYQPPGAKDFVVGLFGTNDKLALEVFVGIVALAIGAGLGVLGRTRPTAATLAIGAFAGAGLLASLRDPASSLVVAVMVAGAETLLGGSLLGWLLDSAPGSQASAADSKAPTTGTLAAAARPGGMPDWTRRRLLIRGGGVAAASIVAVGVGRWLTGRTAAPTASEPLPEPTTLATLPAGADLATSDLTAEGLTPIVVPNDAFYRIDTALLTPSVDASSWSLRVHGLVDREVTLSYDQLVQLPIVEQYVTIACVSNEVGGNLVGNALWRGVPLRTVLAMAGVQASATQLVGRSVDGFTVGMPTAWVMDESRVPLIAIGMNGQPLPREHGYPARLIVPGLYGYVSATKWLADLELTTLDAFDAYWVALGWAKEAPILTQSRIDVPRVGDTVKAGPIAIAGVAWAPDRGIERVEVSIDGGAWQAATISAPISDATWVQWLVTWTATAGDHEVEVRATDKTGAVQTADQTTPFPDGARGHHKIGFRAA